MHSSRQDRVVCRLLGGTGRRTHEHSRFTRVIRAWFHGAVAFLAAVAS